MFVQYFYFFSANLGAKLAITHNGTTIPGIITPAPPSPSPCFSLPCSHPSSESNYFYSTIDSVPALLEAIQQQQEGSVLAARSAHTMHLQQSSRDLSATHSDTGFRWGVPHASDAQHSFASGGRKLMQSQSAPQSASKVRGMRARAHLLLWFEGSWSPHCDGSVCRWLSRTSLKNRMLHC